MEGIKIKPGIYIVNTAKKTIVAGPYTTWSMEVDQKLYSLIQEGEAIKDYAVRAFDGKEWGSAL